MPKRENYDRNPQSAEAERRKRQAITQTPQRRIAQLRYRLDSIEESVKAGRQQYEEVYPDVQRLRVQLGALEAQEA